MAWIKANRAIEKSYYYYDLMGRPLRRCPNCDNDLTQPVNKERYRGVFVVCRFYLLGWIWWIVQWDSEKYFEFFSYLDSEGKMVDEEWHQTKYNYPPDVFCGKCMKKLLDMDVTESIREKVVYFD